MAVVTAVLMMSVSVPVQAEEKSATAQRAEKAEVGKAAPAFTLTDIHGKEVSLGDFKGKTVVLEWFNPGCPFVKRVHLENGPMPAMVKKHVASGGVWLAINSGAPGKQGTGKEANLQALKDYSINWPLLMDEAGTVGRIYENSVLAAPHTLSARIIVVSPWRTQFEKVRRQFRHVIALVELQAFPRQVTHIHPS